MSILQSMDFPTTSHVFPLEQIILHTAATLIHILSTVKGDTHARSTTKETAQYAFLAIPRDRHLTRSWPFKHHCSRLYIITTSKYLEHTGHTDRYTSCCGD